MTEQLARDVDEFDRWLRYARPGAERQYWEGFLMSDRLMDTTADLLGHAAWEAYKRGKVVLYQYRLSRGRYLYFAKRIK